MIWEFWKYEKYHGAKATAYEVVMHGGGRDWVFANDPKNQRMCKCQNCGTKIAREVPRIKLDASYYYGAGYYCLSCGVKALRAKHHNFERTRDEMERQMKSLDTIIDIAHEVMEDEWYPKKMALGKMFQVMEENQSK